MKDKKVERYLIDLSDWFANGLVLLFQLKQLLDAAEAERDKKAANDG